MRTHFLLTGRFAHRSIFTRMYFLRMRIGLMAMANSNTMQYRNINASRSNLIPPKSNDLK